MAGCPPLVRRTMDGTGLMMLLKIAPHGEKMFETGIGHVVISTCFSGTWA
jgi:hypothetical protein